jgi:DNA polymerase-3 subunit delta
MLQAAVANVARHNVFELGPAVLSGDKNRVARIVRGLEAEGEPAILALWALQEEVRALSIVQSEIAHGQNLQAALRQAKVWGERQNVFGAALKRHNKKTLATLHQQAVRADKIAKGLIRSNPWQAILMLALGLAGQTPIELLETTT